MRLSWMTGWLALAVAVSAPAVSSASGPGRGPVGPSATQAVGSAAITSIEVRNVRGQPTKLLAPTDTVLVDIWVADSTGFRNVSDVEMALSLGTAAGVGMATWQGARVIWQRGTTPAWSFRTTKSDGWQLLPALSSVDTVTNATTPQRVRFAIVSSTVARADAAGWQVQAWTGTVTAKAAGYGMAERVEWTLLSARGDFAAGTAGQSSLPLSTPTTGQVSYRLVSNTAVSLTATVPAFAGLTDPGARFGGGAADTTVRWNSTSVSGTTVGYLDSLAAPVGRNIDALTDTSALRVDLELHLALPAVVPPQSYLTNMTVAATSVASALGGSHALDLTATVLGSGLAAGSATAEVEPHSVLAGTVDQPMLARLGFTVGLGETGINRVRVALPAGWSAPHVTSVTGPLGFPIAFADSSSSESAIAQLASSQLLGPIVVNFTATAPKLADPVGAGFVTYFDDTATAVQEQVATEGNPDLVGGSGWQVVVVPAAAADLTVRPATAERLVGDSVSVSASVTDAYGNVRAGDPITWSESGGAGSVDASGLYVAQAVGLSRVIGTSGALADTALISVSDPAASAQFSPLPVASVRLLPGASPVEIARLRVLNPSSLADTVEVLDLADVSIGPVLDADRADSWSVFELRDSTGKRLATSLWASGRVRFENVGLPVPAGSSRRLSVFGAAALRARDGDSLGVVLDSDTDVELLSGRKAVLIDAAPPTRFVVDGMTAAQLTIESLANGPVLAGARRRAVARIRVPGNGWDSDLLLRLNVENLGTARPDTDLARVEAWLDGGDGALDTLADTRLGQMLFTGDRWELTGLSVAVPDTGMWVILSVDVPAGARDGRTLRFALPTLPDVGLGMASGNSGPIDRVAMADHDDVIGGGERILVTATALTGGSVSAGQRGIPALELSFANGYAESRTISSLLLTDVSTGAGNITQLDAEFAHVALGLASGTGAQDATIAAPLAVGSFANGRVLFDGLDLVVPAGGEVRLLVTVDVDGVSATDGDHLVVSLESPQDIEFVETTTVAGTWPARSGAVWTVDGFVASQAPIRPVAGLTLAPGDGPVPVLDFVLPGDGYLADVLHGVRVVNLGNAVPSEIAELRLYRDGGDDVFGGASSDDVDLGPLVAQTGQWQSAYLSDPLPVGGARYYVGLTVAGTTSDSSLVRVAIPTGGVEMESGDDGPLDAALANPDPHVLSTRPLLASLELDPVASTIGQQVDVRLTVRNVGTEDFSGVAPGALVAEGSAGYQSLTGPTPASDDLAPGESGIFTWTLAPSTAGDLSFSTTASGTGQTTLLERRTLVAHSGLGRVYMEADSLRLVALQSMPSAVNRGQTGVVPLTLTLEHPGDASSSAIVFKRLRVRLEQEDGSPIVPADLLGAIEVREGTTLYLRRTSLETVGNEIDLTLATPVTVTPGDPVSLALRLDIASATTVTSFRLLVPDSSVFVAEDAISGAPVRVRLQDQPYPVESGLARILSGDGALVLTAPAAGLRHASSGQAGVPLATWAVAHSSSQSTSADLRLNAVWVRSDAPTGLPSPLPWTSWRVLANGYVVNTHPVAAGDTGDVRLDLVPAPVVQPGGSVQLRFVADLATGAAGSRFALQGVRLAEWDVRDVNTGDAVPLVVTPPVSGDTLVVDAPATELDVTPQALMPATVAAGRTKLPALALALHHPGAAGVADVRVDSVRVSLHAPDGRLLPMDEYLASLRLLRRGVPVSVQVAPAGSDVVLAAADTVTASGTDTLTLEVDVAADAPAATIGLGVAGDAILACDANSNALVAVTPVAPAAWPFESGLASIVAPARELRVSATSELPALVAPSGAATVPVARLVLRHPGPAGADSITVDHVVVSAADAGGAALDVGAVAGALELHIGPTAIAQAALTADSATATLAFAAPVQIAAEDSVVFELFAVPRAADPGTRFRLGWRSDGIGVVQPGSALLAVAVLAAPGSSFPMWSDAASFSSGDLARSYQNYPNPFAAGRDVTTFAWLMPGPGRATLRIWTPRGEPVATLLDGAEVPAGLRQSDRWDGRNGRGAVVANGVYVAELDVTFDDGGHQRVLRKVAVVR